MNICNLESAAILSNSQQGNSTNVNIQRFGVPEIFSGKIYKRNENFNCFNCFYIHFVHIRSKSIVPSERFIYLSTEMCT
jgi:hypothetical protein